MPGARLRPVPSTRTIPMKLRAPDGTVSFSHDGVETFVDADGTIEVDAALADTLQSLGFIRSVDISDMGRDEVVSRLMDRARAKLDSMSDDDLRTALTNVMAAEQKQDDAKEVDPAAVTAEAIAAMSRSELFAYLRQKGVAAGAVSNDMLRDIAKKTLAAEQDAKRAADEAAAKAKAEADAKAKAEADAKAKAEAAAAAKVKADADAPTQPAAAAPSA